MSLGCLSDVEVLLTRRSGGVSATKGRGAEGGGKPLEGSPQIADVSVHLHAQ